jgi:hypothetical protein
MAVHCLRREGGVRELVALELTKMAFAHAPLREFSDEQDALRAIADVYEQSLRIVGRLHRGDG